jgi:hypothetical protein
MFKRFIGMVVLGVGMELGSILAKEGIEIAKDPYKRTVIKQKTKKIKDTIFKKEEES